ncbi:MAG: hypothetical protein OEV85_09675 [Candidatus Thorarchaeota archaeon]|nr:hypothetical protein [Candidatus Thorarchaeota archaeon]
MDREKKTKSEKNVSLSELIDDFVDLDVTEDPRKVTGLTDEDYVNMMLRKEARRKLDKSSARNNLSTSERPIKTSTATEEISKSCQNCFYCAHVVKLDDTLLCACTNSEREHETAYSNKWWVIGQDNPRCWKNPPKSELDAMQRLNIDHASESDQTRDRGDGQLDKVDSILLGAGKPKTSSESIKASEQAPETVAAVEFLRDELRLSSSRKTALETLKKYRKDAPIAKEKIKEQPIVSEKISPVRRCQNCYFCVAERTLSGSCWCHCSNPGRSIEAIPGKPWVKSKLNLPCWKAMQH